MDGGAVPSGPLQGSCARGADDGGPLHQWVGEQPSHRFCAPAPVCAGAGLQPLSGDLGLLDLCLDKRTESISDAAMVESCGLTALVRHPNADQLGLGRAYAIWPTGTARSSACPVARLERWLRVPARGRGRHRQRLAACPTHG